VEERRASGFPLRRTDETEDQSEQVLSDDDESESEMLEIEEGEKKTGEPADGPVEGGEKDAPGRQR
jgi:hypothetical protein